MQVTRVYSDSAGETHFAVDELTFTALSYAPPAPDVHVSAFVPATWIGFVREPSSWGGAAHPTPRRQFLLVLGGAMRMEVSDGEARVFPVGSIFLLEDVAGVGHRTTFIGDDDLQLALVQLPDQA